MIQYRRAARDAFSSLSVFFFIFLWLWLWADLIGTFGMNRTLTN
jgi:hypothetical protein